MNKSKKVILIGLEGLNPYLLYKWKNKLPNLSRIMENGICGIIQSTVPPNLSPAWSSVLSGKNPGSFGYWDFTYRNNYSYIQSGRVDSRVMDKRVSTLYQIIARYGKKVAMVNVPITYPPLEIANGYIISNCISPCVDEKFIYPAFLREEIREIIEDCIIDDFSFCMPFMQADNEAALKQIQEMDKQQFEITRYFVGDNRCDFVFSVIMGVDRIAHQFYSYLDKKHNRYTPNTKYKGVLKNHYNFCDENIGDILNFVDKNTVVIVLSCYGVQRLDGRINLNEWLIREGYMSLKARPEKLIPYAQASINWPQTKAWAVGYTGELYLNIKGREAQGMVEPQDYDKLLDELTTKISSITDDNGNRLHTSVYKRKDIHSGEYARFGPDLFINFDNCHWSASELIGYDSIYSYDIPEGPDYGSHGPYGFFAIYGPGVPETGETSKANLLDIAPTVLDLMDLPLPPDSEGNTLINKECFNLKKDRKAVSERLSKLGYLG